MRHVLISAIWAALVCLAGSAVLAQPVTPDPNYVTPYDPDIFPPQIAGPYISRSDVVMELDCSNANEKTCLSFKTLMRVIVPADQLNAPGFNLFSPRVGIDGGPPVRISELIKSDIDQVAHNNGADDEDAKLRSDFLTYEGGELQLVGAIGRIDRSFIKDRAGAQVRQLADPPNCGEISLIYRFAYAKPGPGSSFGSRLPVTINLVFPMVPFTVPSGSRAPSCQRMAQLWLKTVEDIQTLSTQTNLKRIDVAAFARELRQTGALAYIDGRDLLRMEFNIQAFRLSAASDSEKSGAQFGTKSGYIFRVLKWNARDKYFVIAKLRNQLNRAKVLCTEGPGCPGKTALVKWLNERDQIAAIDRGTFELPDELLERRSVSISPGGMHRSGNQPFWKPCKTLPCPGGIESDGEDVLSDADIKAALDKHDQQRSPLSFIKSVEDVRVRLNEGSCTGCHQTRAIAGFHFPGADRPDTPRANSVLLPGSAHFYGDQPRRMMILKAIAEGKDPDIRLHYTARPKYDLARPPRPGEQTLYGTQLIGGWGSACLTKEAQAGSKREWNCNDGLECKQVFISRNDPGAGTCLPKSPPDTKSIAVQVGDPAQVGDIASYRFGRDCYVRKAPNAVGKADKSNDSCALNSSADTRIARSSLPPAAPSQNSFYGAHQEYFDADDSRDAAYKDKLRDEKTGGFPAGTLRLSECKNLPSEATCGLIASSGFNDCLADARTEKKISLLQCFSYFTSYSGLRACDAGSPCRDDYICVKPIKDEAEPKSYADIFAARRSLLENDHRTNDFYATVRKKVIKLRSHGKVRAVKVPLGIPYRKEDFYGQDDPDGFWVARNGGKGDRRGVCIPPYFVFQFKADGHVVPSRN